MLQSSWKARAEEVNRTVAGRSGGIDRAAKAPEAEVPARRAMLHRCHQNGLISISFPVVPTLETVVSASCLIGSRRALHLHLTQRVTDIPAGTGAAVLRISHAMLTAAPQSWQKLLTAGEAGALAEASLAVNTSGLGLGEAGAFFVRREDRTRALALRDRLLNSSDLIMALRKLYDLFSAFVPSASIRGSQSLNSRILQMPIQQHVVDASLPL